MYPLIELATGLLFVTTFLEYGITQATVKWIFFTCFIIVLTITDLRVRLLPDLVTWPGFAVGLLFSAFVPPNDGTALALLIHWFKRLRIPPMWVIGVLEGALGAAFGSFLLWGLAVVYKTVRKREGMGMGDVKMMAMVGAFVGLRGTFWTILLGSLLGSVIGLSVVAGLYLGGWKKRLAERASRRGLGNEMALRWTIASQYQLPLGTFLGIGALTIVYGGPLLAKNWPSLSGIFG
jgi:leader peptidase (prepilin peptidase)/N-methyltransferase